MVEEASVCCAGEGAGEEGEELAEEGGAVGEDEGVGRLRWSFHFLKEKKRIQWET